MIEVDDSHALITARNRYSGKKISNLKLWFSFLNHSRDTELIYQLK